MLPEAINVTINAGHALWLVSDNFSEMIDYDKSEYRTSSWYAIPGMVYQFMEWHPDLLQA